MRLVAGFASSTLRMSASTRRRSTSGSTRERPTGPSWVEFERLWRSIGSVSKFFGLGARNAALETFEWQAPRFYKKHGYEEVTRIEGYAKGFYLAMMKKAL